MTVNNFDWILLHIHINDISLIPNWSTSSFDKLYKIKPFVNLIQKKNYLSNFNPSQTLAINESMIKFKSRNSMKTC